MLAISIPPGTSPAVRFFLQGWSMCMRSMPVLTEADKNMLKELFEQILEPQAHCPEMKALDHAFLTYLFHKCGSPEAVGSAAPKGDA